jgi:hypothetical protein
MVKKVTYSRRHNDKRRVPYDHESAHENDGNRKRSKVEEELAELRLPTPPSSRQRKKPSLLKKGLFGGPVSIPDDDTEINPATKSRRRLSIFDKVLGEGRHQAAKPHQNKIRGDRENFAEIMKNEQRLKEQNDQRRNSYLPTPPAEADRKAHELARSDKAFLHYNGYASNGGLKTLHTPAAPTRTSQLFEQVINNEQPKEPYKPKAYKSEETAAPRRTITRDRLSRKSEEAQR